MYGYTLSRGNGGATRNADYSELDDRHARCKSAAFSAAGNSGMNAHRFVMIRDDGIDEEVFFQTMNNSHGYVTFPKTKYTHMPLCKKTNARPLPDGHLQLSDLRRGQ